MQLDASTPILALRSTAVRIWHWTVPGCIVAAAYLDLAIQSSSPGGATWIDLARCVTVVTLSIGFVAIACNRTQHFPSRSGILAFSLLFHLIGVSGSPVLEDDGNRYLFDGWVFAERGSPYGIAPSAFFDSETLQPEIESILSGVNNPDFPTVYGPTTEWVFLLAHSIWPGQIVILQAIMACLGFALICSLSRWAKPLPLLFFAWHPLLIKEFAFTGHFDVLAVLFILVALSIPPHRLEFVVGIALALAVGTKLFAILIVPAILRGRLHSRLRSRAVAWVAFGVTLVALYLPFSESIFLPDLLRPGGGLEHDPLWTMATAWIFNAPLYVLLQPVMDPWVLRALLATFLIGYWISWTHASFKLPDTEWPRGDRLFGIMLICLPVLNPWYLIWPMLFWVRRPTSWLAIASITILFSYATGLNLGDHCLAPYELPNSILIAEYMAIAIGLGFDIWYRRV